MAISTDAGLLAMLKTYYAKDGLQNLLYRNDPLLKYFLIQQKSCQKLQDFLNVGLCCRIFFTFAAHGMPDPNPQRFFDVELLQLTSALFVYEELLGKLQQTGSEVKLQLRIRFL